MKSFFSIIFLVWLSVNPVLAKQSTYEAWIPLNVLPALTLTSNVQGRVTQVYVKANQSVTPSSALLSVADPVLDEKLQLLKNRYESSLKTLSKQEKLFTRNKIDYSEYLYARNQNAEAAQAYWEFLKKHDQTVSLDQKVRVKKIFVRGNQDVYYGMPLFELVLEDTYLLTAKLPFDYLKKLGINKKINLLDDQNQIYAGKVQALDIKGRDFFVVIKVNHPGLKENQKLKLTL